MHEFFDLPPTNQYFMFVYPSWVLNILVEVVMGFIIRDSVVRFYGGYVSEVLIQRIGTI